MRITIALFFASCGIAAVWSIYRSIVDALDRIDRVLRDAGWR